MTTAAPPKPKPKRETWRSWMPANAPEPAELISREDFIARVNALGADVSEGDLRFWEYHGVLPRAVKRWKDGANRVFYPRWMIGTVTQLRLLQRLGHPLREIGPRLRAHAPKAVDATIAIEEANRDPTFFETSGLRGDRLLQRAAARAVCGAVLQTGIRKLTATFESVMGQPVARTEVRFLDADGATLGAPTEPAADDGTDGDPDE